MNKLIALFLMLILCACSTTGGKKTGQDARNDIDEDFSWLENEDFKKVSETSYVAPKDLYPQEIAEVDSLAAESVARFPKGKLDAVVDHDDIISKIVGTCYQQEFKEADELIRSSRRQYNANPSFWNQVGTCYFMKGEKRKALIFYNKSISLKKDYAPAVNNLGVLYQHEGNDQRALAAYEEASRLSSFSLTPAFNMAQLYLKYGFVDKAERVFSTLWQKNKRDKDVIHAIAVIYLMQKKYDKSISAFHALKHEIQERPGVALNYALALALGGNKKDAKTVLEGLKERNISTHLAYYRKVRQVVGM